MFFYRYTNPNSSETFVYSSSEDLTGQIGERGEGDFRFFVPCEAPTQPPPSQTNIKKTIIQLLQRSDWTQLLDTPLTPETVDAWKQYRQALRNLDTTDPTTVVFPLPPDPNISRSSSP